MREGHERADNQGMAMKQYLDLIRYILENGEEREDRTGTGTINRKLKMSNNKLGIFEGLTFDNDRFFLFPRCYGAFLKKTEEDKKAGCTLSAFWVGLGFEPIEASESASGADGWKHPITGDNYSNQGLQNETNKLAMSFNVVPENNRSFTTAIIGAHDTSVEGNRSHEYAAMQLIHRLVEAAGLQPKVSIPEAVSMAALNKFLK